jgi:large-conductance mechanosensitive channel
MLIELVLTIFAWRKGWGPIALLPLAVGVTFGVVFAQIDHSLVPAVMADILIYATLITMIVVGRKTQPAHIPHAPAQ